MITKIVKKATYLVAAREALARWACRSGRDDAQARHRTNRHVALGMESAQVKSLTIFGQHRHSNLTARAWGWSDGAASRGQGEVVEVDGRLGSHTDVVGGDLSREAIDLTRQVVPERESRVTGEKPSTSTTNNEGAGS